MVRLYEELAQATISNPKGSLPTYDQIRSLPYLTACINESMRLRPVAANGRHSMHFCELLFHWTVYSSHHPFSRIGVPREVPEDTTMAGYFIPKGTSKSDIMSKKHKE
jgi:cytochrome P450